MLANKYPAHTQVTQAKVKAFTDHDTEKKLRKSFQKCKLTGYNLIVLQGLSSVEFYSFQHFPNKVEGVMGCIFRNFSDPRTRVEILPLSAVWGVSFSAIDIKTLPSYKNPLRRSASFIGGTKLLGYLACSWRATVLIKMQCQQPKSYSHGNKNELFFLSHGPLMLPHISCITQAASQI